MTTLRQAAQQFVADYDCGGCGHFAAYAENFRKALAQEEQEPVLVVEQEPDYMSRGHFHEGSKPFIDPTEVWKLPIGTKLYTHPARRDALAQEEDIAQNLQSRHDAAKLLEERRQEIDQPRREWQGLTTQEAMALTDTAPKGVFYGCDAGTGLGIWIAAVAAAERALKEKNNG